MVTVGIASSVFNRDFPPLYVRKLKTEKEFIMKRECFFIPRFKSLPFPPSGNGDFYQITWMNLYDVTTALIKPQPAPPLPPLCFLSTLMQNYPWTRGQALLTAFSAFNAMLNADYV